MTYQYQILGPSNVDLIKDLLKVFAEAFEEPETYQGAVPDQSYLEKLLKREYIIALVALHRKKVIGGLVAYELEKFEQKRSEIYIYDLAVAKPHRRKGVATALLHELKKVAKSKKAYVLFVQADPGDLPAIELYKSLGTREDVHHFDILLD